jgi:hypothetical protein
MTLRYDQPESLFDSGLFYPSETALSTKRMKKIRLGISKLSPDSTASLGEGLVESMTGNAHVPTPDPALSVITTGAGDIRAKQAEIEATKAALDVQRQELVTLTNTLKDDIRMLADNVEDTCNGDEDKLRSTGFILVGDPAPRGPLTQVLNLRVATSDHEGQLDLRYARVPGAASYVIDISTNPEGPWTHNTVTTRITHTITGLTPGTKYWIRVRAVGANGFGPWSDPACKMAA